MRAFVTAGAGFLLAVLWFDLMFDVQVLPHRGADVPESALESIARYYRRVTTGASPMNRLVAAVMLGTLAAIGLRIAGMACTRELQAQRQQPDSMSHDDGASPRGFRIRGVCERLWKSGSGQSTRSSWVNPGIGT